MARGQGQGLGSADSPAVNGVMVILPLVLTGLQGYSQGQGGSYDQS